MSLALIALLASVTDGALGQTSGSGSAKEVRTIKDFPELTQNNQGQKRITKNSGSKRVRTAADFKRRSEDQAIENSQALDSEGNPVQIDLSKAPEKKEETIQYLFSIPGADFVNAAVRSGALLWPKGGKLQRDGTMAAFQMAVHPGVMTSHIRGNVMTQVKPSEFWVIKSSKNVFNVFTDDKGKPIELSEGWSVAEVVLKGKNFRWLHQPQKGARSPYFTIEITAFHHADTVVQLAGVRLIGPPGETDWTKAFK